MYINACSTRKVVSVTCQSLAFVSKSAAAVTTQLARSPIKSTCSREPASSGITLPGVAVRMKSPGLSCSPFCSLRNLWTSHVAVATGPQPRQFQVVQYRSLHHVPVDCDRDGLIQGYVAKAAAPLPAGVHYATVQCIARNQFKCTVLGWPVKMMQLDDGLVINFPLCYRSLRCDQSHTTRLRCRAGGNVIRTAQHRSTFAHAKISMR